MEPASENTTRAPEGSVLSDLLVKVKAVAQSPHGELFARIVDDFYEQITEEYFSPEDLADIQEGLAQIERGETIPWEELKRELDL
jgi:hypothetical protein